MAKITDPDNIDFAINTTATNEEFEIQTGAKTMQVSFAGSSAIDDDAPGKTSGTTGKAYYSALKIKWLASSVLRKYKFPVKMIFEGSFIVTNGWTFLDDQTRDVMRDAGFQEETDAKENACMVSLGAMDDSAVDQAYYAQDVGFTATTQTYDKTGELNENIDISTKSSYKKSFLREWRKTYAEYDLLSEQGLSGITFQAYSFPLSNGTDLKIDETLHTDAIVGGSNDPYQNMGVTYLNGAGFTTAVETTYSADDVIQDTAGRWAFCTTGGTLDSAGVADYTTNGGTSVFEAYEGEGQIGASYYAFNRLLKITAGSYTDVQAYAFMQYQLRQAGEINVDDTTSAEQGGFGTVNGEVAELLAEYVGANLKPKPGVLLVGFDTNSTNSIQHSPITVDGGGLDSNFVPLTSSEVAYPFVAAGNMNFSASLTDELDGETIHDMYFEYITSTEGLLTFTSASGNTATLTYTGALLDHLEDGDYVTISGCTSPINDGEYLIGTVTAGTSVALTHQDTTVTLVDDAEATLVVLENPYNSLGAELVNDNSSSPITGVIDASSIAFDFDYTNNVQKGRAPDSDAAVVVIAMALDGAEWTIAYHTISKSTGQAIPVNSNDERNYSNPA